MRMPWYAQPKWHFAMNVLLAIVFLILGATSIYSSLRGPETGEALEGIVQIVFAAFWLHLAISHRKALRADKAEWDAILEDLRKRQQEYASRHRTGSDQAS